MNDPHEPQETAEPQRPVDPQPPATPAAAPAGATAAEATAAERPVPTEAELERVAQPATLRRAPRYGAFITAGALIGAVLGIVLVNITSRWRDGVEAGTGFISVLEGAGTARLLTGLALAVAGGLIGGALAVRADRRSTRKG